MADELPHAPWVTEQLPHAPWVTSPDQTAPQVPQPFIDRVRAGQQAEQDGTADRIHDSITDGPPPIFANSPFEDAAARIRRRYPQQERKLPLMPYVVRGLAEGMVESLRTLPQRFIEEAGRLQRTGEYGEDGKMPVGLEAALLTMGVGTKFARTTLEHVTGKPQEQMIGTLPTDADFKTGAAVLGSDAAEPKLRTLWEERGIHPAEAVHDAQRDAWLKGELTSPDREPADRSGIPHPQSSPIPEGTPRSVLARTGEGHIDRILESDVTKRAIDNPVIDHEHTVPYTAGGSVPLQDPTMFIDRRFPRELTVDGVTFDPADPFVIHENLEQHVMEVLIKGGMDKQTAYKVAHFEFAEKAEGAWYRAHGIDQAKAEAAYAPFMAAIQHAKAEPIIPPPPKPGTTRFYHGGAALEVTGEGPRWLTPDLKYAKTGYTTPGMIYASPKGRFLHYVDIANDSPLLHKSYDDTGTSQIAPFVSFEAPWSIAQDLKPYYSDGIPPNLYKDPYPHDAPSAAAHEALAEPKPTKAEIARAKAILDSAESASAPLRALGADVAGDMPSLAQQPPQPPGRLAGAGRNAVDQLFGLGRNIQFLLDPMATGSNRAMVIAKDAISSVRRVEWEATQRIRDLEKRFDKEQHGRMWNAADEESVARQLGESREHQGLVTLTADERAAVEAEHANLQQAWLTALDVGMVEGEGLPAYTPRMAINVAFSEGGAPRALNDLGRNVQTKTARLLHRKYMTAEETEAALQHKFGPEAALARDIRTLPMAAADLQKAAIWRQMINKIEDIGKATGDDMVASFNPGEGWFTIVGNPAFTKWGPKEFQRNPETGAWEPLLDANGNIIMAPKPIYMRDEFRGPMTSILDESAMKGKVVRGAQSLYGALMLLKGKSMTAILNSPLIHNEVVWSKVAEAAGGREWLGFGLYWKGNRIVNSNPARASELIERGLQPMGPRGAYQDLTSMMEQPSLQGHQSWTGKLVAFVPGLFDARAGAATEGAIQKAGNFWHNTLLWDRVRDVQFGLADHLSDRLVAHGADRLTADRVASHFSNIIVGSIPKEAMSAAARATANMLLFSRSFTLGNLSTFKQAAMGLPKPILAQIERDTGMTLDAALGEGGVWQVTKTANSIARWKAFNTIMLSAGLYYVGNALIQHAFNILARDSSVDEEMKGYARRYQSLMSDASKDPFELRHLLGRLSPTYDNEPAKQDRAHIGYDKDGTAIYARNPTGKFGEEMVGYPTQPMSMVRRKLSPLAGGILDILENDKGFGRKIYDENDTTITGDVKTAFAVAKHLVMKHLPEGQIMAGIDLLHGEGDPTVNKLRVFGPALGFTASVGAPSGPARGEQFAVKSQFDARFNLAWPDIKKQIQRGDIEGAREALTGLRVPPPMQNGLIRNATNPGAALHGRTLRDFYQRAMPQQIERFEFQRERTQ